MQYLTKIRLIFYRCHSLALHSDESSYKCVHCEEKLATEKGAINVDYIIKHLRLHELHLYKCKYCKFLHHLKHKVDRHLTEKHPDKPSIIIVVRELEHEPEERQEQHEEFKEIKDTKPWRCGMCKYRCTNKTEVVSHVFNKHDVESQFKCALCQFRSNEKTAFPFHFESNHPGQSTDVIDAYFEVEEVQAIPKNSAEATHFDTTPLWQRDKNRFKHIRGIPLDETNKTPKRSPSKSSNFSDNLHKSIDAVASGASEFPEKDLLKTPVLKKPKTLKEKKMELKTTLENRVKEVSNENTAKKVPEPIIVKQEPLEELTKTSQKGVRKNKPVYQKCKTELSLQEIEKLDIEALRNGELSGTYGPFGKPLLKQYLCPLCNIFKTKKVQDITYHLYKELHYSR